MTEKVKKITRTKYEWIKIEINRNPKSSRNNWTNQFNLQFIPLCTSS